MTRHCLLFLLLASALCEIVPLHRHVAQEIFQENKPYLIYVHGAHHNFQAEAVFNGYCFGDKLCAILNPHLEDYQHMLQYIGNNEEEYFLIIDAASKRKYVLSLPAHSLTQNDLLSFEYRFLNHQLEPYFASEPAPQQGDCQSCKLVGSNLGEFLRREERMKVILLHSPSQYCQSCPAVLEEYQQLAAESGFAGEVAFGYFNSFLNDHPVIHDEKTPNLIIFLDQNFETPFQLGAADLSQLRSFIAQTLPRRGRNQQEM